MRRRFLAIQAHIQARRVTLMSRSTISISGYGTAQRGSITARLRLLQVLRAQLALQGQQARRALRVPLLQLPVQLVLPVQQGPRVLHQMLPGQLARLVLRDTQGRPLLGLQERQVRRVRVARLVIGRS